MLRLSSAYLKLRPHLKLLLEHATCLYHSITIKMFLKSRWNKLHVFGALCHVKFIFEMSDATCYMCLAHNFNFGLFSKYT
jgi:hypothetical protein